MPITITGANAKSTIQGPASGDPRTAASVVTMGQALADNITYDRTRLDTSIGTVGTPVTRCIQRPPFALSTAWSNDAAGTCTALTTTASILMMPVTAIDVPQGATVTSIIASITGATGHSAFPGGAPATMPKVSYKRVAIVGGTTSPVAQADTSATAGAFEALHTITFSGGFTTDYTQFLYFLTLASEGSTNAIAGDVLLGFQVIYNPA